MIQLSEHEKHLQIIEVLKKTLREEQSLREKFGIKDKHRYIPNKLKILISRLEAKVERPNQAHHVIMPPWIKKVEDDETIVYISLYHAKGQELKSWERVLGKGGLDEIGVNRPVYRQRFEVEKFVNSSQTKYNHGYASVIVKKSEVIETSNLQDSLGQAIVRLVDGSILEDKVIDFVHCDTEYFLNQRGRLVRKEDFTP